MQPCVALPLRASAAPLAADMRPAGAPAQHGANALFAIGELLLNTIPFVPHLMGYVGFWTSAFGIWGAPRACAPASSALRRPHSTLCVHLPWPLPHNLQFKG